MSLVSALNDFVKTTLRSVPGTLGKLDYVSGLQQGEAGSYVHWGLARVHGEREARQAMAEVHRQVLSELLSTPIRLLLEDVCQSAGETAGYVEELRARRGGMLPENSSDGSVKHLSSVLHALSLLAQARRETTLPVS